MFNKSWLVKVNMKLLKIKLIITYFHFKETIVFNVCVVTKMFKWLRFHKTNTIVHNAKTNGEFHQNFQFTLSNLSDFVECSFLLQSL